VKSKAVMIIGDARGTYANAADVEEDGFWRTARRHCRLWINLCVDYCYEGIIVVKAHTYARVVSTCKCGEQLSRRWASAQDSVS
jgi:hypothetical protein